MVPYLHIVENQSQNKCNINMYIWVFPKIGVPQNGWFISWKTPIKMGRFGGKTPIFGNTHINMQKEDTVSTTGHPPARCHGGALGSLETGPF